MLTIAPEPLPSADALRNSVTAFLGRARVAVRPNDLDARDVRFIERTRPLLDLFYDRYFRCETELEAPLPGGPFLAIANHNGMTGTPDMFCHMAAFWRHCGTERPAYGLMHDVPFGVPFAGAWLNGVGAIAASPDNAHRALARGAAVLVFPGGDIDACKPYRDRYRIDFGKRRGFVRTAIREQVPIVPVVSAGGHHSLYLFTDGRKIAEALRLPEIARSNVWPIGFALPLGLVFGVPYPHVPPPVKVHTRFLEPIHLDLPPEAEHDAEAVERAYRRVVGAMQAAMHDLARQGRHGLWPRD